jgi:hypothetical protein
VILVVPFLIYEDVKIIQNEEPITKYSLPWLKQLCLTGDRKYGLWVECFWGGGGGGIGVAECVWLFFFCYSKFCTNV